MANTKPKKQNPPTNFLEALRELGRDVASEAQSQAKQVFTQDVPDSLGLPHSSGTLKPNESLSVSRNQTDSAAERKTDTHFSQRLTQMREEEQARVRRQDAEVREQIKQIQLEIKSLAKAAGELAAEVQVASIQAVVNPGEYHKHFFTRLLSLIKALRLKVNESRHWLAEFNNRSQKKGAYWSNVKKSGTSYMLSSERYMVTSTG